MTKKQKTFICIGVAILLFMLIAYFIKIPVESGINYETFSSLLGILIFHSPVFLIIYISIALFLIYKGLNKKIRLV